MEARLAAFCHYLPAAGFALHKAKPEQPFVLKAASRNDEFIGQSNVDAVRREFRKEEQTMS